MAEKSSDGGLVNYILVDYDGLMNELRSEARRLHKIDNDGWTGPSRGRSSGLYKAMSIAYKYRKVEDDV